MAGEWKKQHYGLRGSSEIGYEGSYSFTIHGAYRTDWDAEDGKEILVLSYEVENTDYEPENAFCWTVANDELCRLYSIAPTRSGGKGVTVMTCNETFNPE